MKFTTESFIGVALIMFASIIIIAMACSCLPYYSLIAAVGALLLIKGAFLVVDDLKYESRFIYKILTHLFKL
jgi:uncharacterized membrane protein HdeD (DUF308 family)